MTGMVEGGWGYVYGAYAITWIAWVLYAVSLYVRSQKKEGS